MARDLGRDTVLTIMGDICDWLRANGITPGDVPIEEVPRLANGKITLRVYQRNQAGRHHVTNGQIATEVRTYPLRKQPPGKLAAWLRGEVPVR